jgi:thiamine-phosphate pyrophosphorylase
MHNYPKKFYFIDTFNEDHINKLDKNIGIIYRNYSKKHDELEIIKIKNLCKKTNHKFYLSNNTKLVDKLKLDGAYIPSFNKSLSVLYLKRKGIPIFGSAHNLKEIFQKVRQQADLIFLSSVFKSRKSNKELGINKFNILSNHTKKKIIALGGINAENKKKIKLLNCYGFASISYINNKIKKKHE